jgi:F-type H+-transporting ATPase subunit delta
MLTNRMIKRSARRLFNLCRVDGRADEARMRDVAHRVAASGRHGSLPILWEFLRLVRLDRERRTALVESAAPLTDDLRGTVEAGLAGKYGTDVTTSFALNPSLIGGMRIKVGSDVYDGSVRARLAALRDRF